MPTESVFQPETRIVFMGTPDFATPSLAALHGQASSRNWRVHAVFTQPDRRAGRGNRPSVGPVKAYALEQGLSVHQPERMRKAPDVVETLKQLAPDLIVVVAYGLILPRAVLEIPTFGCINVHASLLPAYRGASPISAAILDGLEETGISVMLMDVGMDTGPVLAQARQSIFADDSTETLGARLAKQGAALLVETLPAWLHGDIAPIDQGDLPGDASTCGLIAKTAGEIDWRASARQIERQTRAYAPWPSAYTTWRGQPFKIWRAAVVAGIGEPGVVRRYREGVTVGTGEGLLELLEVQPAGKRRMDMGTFLNGAQDFIGQQLGD
ncbi:MAG: methionyl-tRNA formyltransferase [Caldilineaceae bacterium]|nr:methionyl-tRNA formyltransferase [Caldilineaceae bacterium]